jgi:hypothetical protein
VLILATRQAYAPGCGQNEAGTVLSEGQTVPASRATGRQSVETAAWRFR